MLVSDCFYIRLCTLLESNQSCATNQTLDNGTKFQTSCVEQINEHNSLRFPSLYLQIPQTPSFQFLSLPKYKSETYTGCLCYPSKFLQTSSLQSLETLPSTPSCSDGSTRPPVDLGWVELRAQRRQWRMKPCGGRRREEEEEDTRQPGAPAPH
jgi:hypothetical protein